MSSPAALPAAYPPRRAAPDDSGAVFGELRVLRAVHDWIAGVAEAGTRVLFIEPGAGAGALVSMLGSDDAVIAPATFDVGETNAHVVRYTGSLLAPGDRLQIGGRSIEMQDYAGASFREVAAPTSLRLGDEAGWSAFLDHADIARRAGVLPALLLDPHVQLAGHAVLSSPLAMEPPTVAHACADGMVRHGMEGVALAPSAEPSGVWGAPVPRLTALGRFIPVAVLRAGVEKRPWLGRYLGAVALMRTLRLDRIRDRICGFGYSVADVAGADAEPLSDDPLLVRIDGQLHLADLATRRRRRLLPEAAEVVEIVQTSTTTELAVDRVAVALATSPHAARSLCEQTRTRLGVRLGTALPPAGGGHTTSSDVS